MSITYTGQKRHQTASSVNLWNNQDKASFETLYKFDGTPSGASNVLLFSRDSYASVWINIQGAGSSGGTVRLKCAFVNASNSTQFVLKDIPVGTVVHIAGTYDGTAGEQWMYFDGVPARAGSLTGNTYSAVKAITLGGWDTQPATGNVQTFGRLSAWNGYVLTPSDVQALRDGTSLPSAIGGGASARALWSLSGTTGATPVVSAGGLAEAGGQTSYDFTQTAGAGTALYSDPLVWTPAARAVSPYVATSGQTIVLPLAVEATGDATNPTTLYTAPTAAVNGTPVTLGWPWISGTPHSCIMFALPVAVGPTDVVTLDAPTGWLGTAGGLCQGLTAVTLGNNVGVSCFGADDIDKTMRLGLNFAGEGMGSDCLYQLTRNMRYRLDAFLATTGVDASGKITASSATTSQAALFKISPNNGLDSTQLPGPTGLFAIGWDDLDPANPTTFKLDTSDGLASATTTFTERTDLKNDGNPDGTGKVRVFNVTRTPGSTTAATTIYVWWSQAQKTPKFANLDIRGPGDFAYADNVPVVLDRSDPYAPAAILLDRLANGSGPIRWMDCLGGYQGISRAAVIEHERTLASFSLGNGGTSASTTQAYTSARPYSAVTSPYIYSHVEGSKFNATLAADIDASTTTLTISDASTAPVFIGLLLYADSEVMRVTGVSGTTVTVVRGCQGTAAAAHTAGTIQVGHRIATPTMATLVLGTGHLFELVTQADHGLYTGQTISWSGTGWPTFTFTDATTEVPSGGKMQFGTMCWVTGPRSYFVVNPGSSNPPTTLSGTQTLDPANCTSTIAIPNGPRVPYALAAIITGRIKGADLHLNIPHQAGDDLIYWYAQQARDNFPAGRTIWLEDSNEPWNQSFGQYRYLAALSRILYPSTNDYAYLINRSHRIRQIFQEVFGPRAGEIKLGINCIVVVSANAATYLAYAQAQSIPIDALEVAPYIDPTSDQATGVAYSKYNAEQCLDLYDHWLQLNMATSGSTAYGYHLGVFKAAIDAYNAATGLSCRLIGYEGGLQVPIPYVVQGGGTVATISGSPTVTGTGTAFMSVFAAGDQIRVGSSTTYTVQSVDSDTQITLTGNASANVSGGSYYLWVKDAIPKTRDMKYSPNFRVVQYNEWTLWQSKGMAHFSQFCYTYEHFKDTLNPPRYNEWGMFHHMFQPWGVGDGSDGKADNRLTLAVQGLPNSKTSNVNQDGANVSVRGYAHRLWNAEVYGTQARRPRFLPRPAGRRFRARPPWRR